MTKRDEIIGAAGTTPENRHVNFLFYQMCESVPASVTLSAGAALPEVLDLESNAPVGANFQSVRTRLERIAGPDGLVNLTLCGNPYSVRITSPDDRTTTIEMTQ